MKRIAKKVTVSLPPWLYDTLKHEAELEHRSVPDYIRHLLWQYAETEKEQKTSESPPQRITPVPPAGEKGSFGKGAVAAEGGD